MSKKPTSGSEPPQLSHLAQRLKDLREESGLSQQSLALKAGIGVSIIQKYEQGRTAGPEWANLGRIARSLGKSLDELWEETAGDD